MRVLLKRKAELELAGRWDIDFHLPPEGIKHFPLNSLQRVETVAEVTKDKRDPTREPESLFQYVDIAAIDVAVGTIVNHQDVEGAEAPSRARKVVRAFDVLVSTCRPTRGAIAVVPPHLHDQIASTAFTILRARDGVNPFYLHYALRLPSTLEQFRKWSTGSSYPAILDADVSKTLIPVPSLEVQDQIAGKVIAALHEREMAIRAANMVWQRALRDITAALSEKDVEEDPPHLPARTFASFTFEAIRKELSELAAVRTDSSPAAASGGEEATFDSHLRPVL